jgi:hypothetical protein
LKEVYYTIRRIRTYNLLYHSLRSVLGRPGLSQAQIEEGVSVTRDVISKLVEAVRTNGADLLIVTLPSWNQINNINDVEEAIQQRALLQKVAEEWDNVYLADLSNHIARAGPERVYGINNKHFSRYGYYLTAKRIHDWINVEWPKAPQPARQAPPFQPPSAPVEPSCRSIQEYREVFIHPGASWRQATTESGQRVNSRQSP